MDFIFIIKIPFDTYTIYVTFDDEKIYELKEDLSKEAVSDMKISTPKLKPRRKST